MSFGFGSIFGGGGGGGGDSGGGFFSGGFSALTNLGGSIYQTERNNQFAGENRDFQERMANTAYQRAVVDMKAAGLNPMLAYRQGGADTPHGAQAVAANFSGIGDNLVKARNLKAQRNKMSAEVRRTDQETTRTEGLVKVDKAVTALRRQEKATSAAMMLRHNIAAELDLQRIPGAKVEAEIDKSAYGKTLRYINRATNSAFGAARAAVTGKKIAD